MRNTEYPVLETAMDTRKIAEIKCYLNQIPDYLNIINPQEKQRRIGIVESSQCNQAIIIKDICEITETATKIEMPDGFAELRQIPGRIAYAMQNPRITVLCLQHALFNSSVAARLFGLVIRALKYTKVTKLSLPSNKLGTLGTEDLSEVFTELKASTVTELNLSNNELADIGADRLAKMLVAIINNSSITRLDLSCNGLSKLELPGLFKVMSSLKGVHRVKYLDMSSNGLDAWNADQKKIPMLALFQGIKIKHLILRDFNYYLTDETRYRLLQDLPTSVGAVRLCSRPEIKWFDFPFEYLTKVIKEQMEKPGQEALAFEIMPLLFFVNPSLRDKIIHQNKIHAPLSLLQKFTLALLYECRLSNLHKTRKPTTADLKEAVQIYKEIADSAGNTGESSNENNLYSLQQIAGFLMEQLNILYPEKVLYKKQSAWPWPNSRYRPAAFSFWKSQQKIRHQKNADKPPLNQLKFQ